MPTKAKANAGLRLTADSGGLASTVCVLADTDDYDNPALSLAKCNLNITKLKLVTWNCNGAFRNKFEHIAEYEADIYIIQECEDPARTPHSKYQAWAYNHLWIGDNKNKGLAIFGKPEIALEVLDWSNQFNGHFVNYFLPCLINDNLELLAVWAHKNKSPNFGYIGQLWKYLQINKNQFNTALIAGDFNSNTIWDEWDRWWNHSDVVRELKELGITSLYHKYTGEVQGKETTPTLYLQRNIQKQYHIDYIFGSEFFADMLNLLEIGSPDTWLKISDHMPMICEFNLDSNEP